MSDSWELVLVRSDLSLQRPGDSSSAAGSSATGDIGTPTTTPSYLPSSGTADTFRRPASFRSGDPDDLQPTPTSGDFFRRTAPDASRRPGVLHRRRATASGDLVITDDIRRRAAFLQQGTTSAGGDSIDGDVGNERRTSSPAKARWLSTFFLRRRRASSVAFG